MAQATASSLSHVLLMAINYGTDGHQGHRLWVPLHAVVEAWSVSAQEITVRASFLNAARPGTIPVSEGRVLQAWNPLRKDPQCGSLCREQASG